MIVDGDVVGDGDGGVLEAHQRSVPRVLRSRRVELLLALPAGPTWSSHAEPGRAVHVAAEPRLRIEVDALAPLPDDRAAWGERVLGRDLPAGGALAQLSLRDDRTAVGWPLTAIATEVRDAGGAVVERRLTGFYELLYYGGAIVCRAYDLPAWAAWEARLLAEVLLAARPDFRGGPVARIDDLFAAAEPRP